MTPAALGVKTPVSTLPPPLPRGPERKTIGGVQLATDGLIVPKDAPPLPSNLAARGWLVADLDTGTVLGACGAHEQHAPASVQKLLLAATMMGKLDPTQIIEVIPSDMNIERGSSAVGLVVGGHYSIETLWLGLLLVSGNDAANVLARLGGGSEGLAGGVRAMNEFAKGLGAQDTKAVTPSGLDGPGQFTTPYDLALIAKACLDREDFRKYALTPSVAIPAQPPKYPSGFQVQNENRLISQYKGALGGKTGFTTSARHSYVGAAERDGRRLVVTILHAEAVPQRAWQQGAALLDWGFSVQNSSAIGRLVKPGEIEASAAASASAAAQAAAARTEPDDKGPLEWMGTPEGLTIAVAMLLAAIIVIAGPAMLVARNRKREADDEDDPPVGPRREHRRTRSRTRTHGHDESHDHGYDHGHESGSGHGYDHSYDRSYDHSPDRGWEHGRQHGQVHDSSQWPHHDPDVRSHPRQARQPRPGPPGGNRPGPPGGTRF